MSKNIIVGLTVVLCVVAAGVGGFFATRTGTAQTAPAASVAATQAEQTPVAVAAVIPEPSPAMAAAPSESPAAPASQARIDSQAAAEAAPQTGAAKKRPVSRAVRKAPAAPAPNTDSSWPGLDKPRPSGTVAAEPPAVAVPPVEQPVTPQVAPPLSPPEPQFEDLVVSADSVLGLQLDSTVNTETARIEDPVDAHVTRDVRVGSMVAIPSGSRALGVVSQLEKGGKMKSRARLGVRFHTLVLADGTRTAIQTDVIFREGEAPGQEAAGKMGAAAAGGAILGAIFGGSKGAAIGGSIGAAGGAAAVMAGGRNAAVLKAGTPVTVRLLQPVTVTVER